MAALVRRVNARASILTGIVPLTPLYASTPYSSSPGPDGTPGSPWDGSVHGINQPAPSLLLSQDVAFETDDENSLLCARFPPQAAQLDSKPRVLVGARLSVSSTLAKLLSGSRRNNAAHIPMFRRGPTTPAVWSCPGTSQGANPILDDCPPGASGLVVRVRPF